MVHKEITEKIIKPGGVRVGYMADGKLLALPLMKGFWADETSSSEKKRFVLSEVPDLCMGVRTKRWYFRKRSGNRVG